VKKILLQIVYATLGFWLASLFIPGVQVTLIPNSNLFGINLTAQWQIFLLLGIILGLLNFFAKPILNIVAIPLRIITFGLFGLIVSGALIWVVDLVFQEFSAPIGFPLFWTTLLIWFINIIGSKFTK